jgi:putative transposon-encoded protein
MRTVRQLLCNSLFYVVSLMLVGCQHDPWADRFVTAQLSEQEVAGAYLVDADSQKRQIKLPMSNSVLPIGASAKIVLSKDHTAQFVNVPEDYQGTKSCLVTEHGSWSLGKNDSFLVVSARIYNEETNSPCKGDFVHELMLYGTKPPYKLHATIGDPDSGDAVQFEKRQ